MTRDPLCQKWRAACERVAPTPATNESDEGLCPAKARGTKYFMGRWGKARITLLLGEPAEDGTATWRMLLAQAPEYPVSSNAKSGEPTAGFKMPSASNTYASRRPGLYGPPPRRPAGVPPLPDDPVDDLWLDEEP